MKDLMNRALDTAVLRGAQYADVRVVHNRTEIIEVKNGSVEILKAEESIGFGVRVLASGAWGFASSRELAAEEVDRVTALALEIAHASAIVQSERVELGPPVTSQGSYQTAIQIDPFDVSMEDKLGVLFAADEEMRRAEESLRVRRGGMTFIRVWYTRLVHPRDCVVTGMTRDGVFMIRDGELAYPVKNLRFTQSYVQALVEVEAVGQQSLLLVNDYTGFATRVPALKVSRFNFTGSTA